VPAPGETNVFVADTRPRETLAGARAGPVHFGLGESASAELIEISWPSGITQKLQNVSGDRIITVTESASPGR
jgi:hypothetical protein